MVPQRIARYEAVASAHLGRLYADKQPSRAHSKGLDLGDPVDILADLESLVVDGRGRGMMRALGDGFLGE